MYSVTSTDMMSKLEQLGLKTFNPRSQGNNEYIKSNHSVILSVNYEGRRIGVSIDKDIFETFFKVEDCTRISYAVDHNNNRLYFIPNEAGYKFNNHKGINSKSRYYSTISGKLFDELRMVKGTITGIKDIPGRDFIYDKKVGLNYIKIGGIENLRSTDGN